MSLKIQYVPGESLDKSYFVATDEKGNEGVARASNVLPKRLHATASANKLKMEPEDYTKELAKVATTVEEFLKVTATMAASGQTLTVTAKAGDEPVNAVEDTPKSKGQDQPVFSAESPLLPPQKEKGGDGEVKQYFAKLPAKSVPDPAWAVDVNSRLQALAEELKKKDDEIAGLKGKLDGKEKEHELDEVLDLLKGMGVTADPLKKDLQGLDAKAIGVLEKVLREVNKGKKDKAPGAPPPAGGPPPFPPKKEDGDAGGGLFPPKKASEDIRSEANITSVTLQDIIGDDISRLSELWGNVDLAKERK
jgi:hypothetical protein